MEGLINKINHKNYEIRNRTIKNLIFKIKNNLLDKEQRRNCLLILEKIFEIFYLKQHQKEDEIEEEERKEEESFLLLCHLLIEVILKWSNSFTEEIISKLSKDLIYFSLQYSDGELFSIITKVN